MAGAALVIAGALLIGLAAEPAWLGWLLGGGGLATLFAGRPADPR